MRALAVRILTAAAVAAGLDADAVMHVPEKDTLTLPARRLEIAYQPEQYRRTGRPLLKQPTPGREDASRTLVREIHSVRLPVRAAIRADDEAWLAEFSEKFLAALPKRTVDEHGRSVSIAVDKAEYGGFTGRLVEVFVKRSKTYLITFTGSRTSSRDVPLIRDVDITPNYREADNGEE